MLTPLLSEYDPSVSTEGTIDPLGTFAIAEALAVQLVPGVRERQSHPRFLTAMAVSFVVCDAFDSELVATDDVSPPWQVFEWYLVEGLVRSTRRSAGDSLRGLPGREKATRAIRDGVPLSARRYLKTPSVFGYHGVYRTLARNLGVDIDGRLGEQGCTLVRVWEEEQGLRGFTGTSEGPGRAWRSTLQDAVRDGLAQGATSRSSGWAGWAFFRDHLGIYEAGSKEARVLRDMLLTDDEGHRAEVLGFLRSGEGRRVLRETESERCFHKELVRATRSGELEILLRAILAYERFTRLLQDAFDDCLFELTRRRGRVRDPDLASLPGVQTAVSDAGRLFEIAFDRLAPVGQTGRFRIAFEPLAEGRQAQDWVHCLMEHHEAVQRRKPPRGRAPWIERFDDGSRLVRAGYRRETGGVHDDRYVHQYRTWPLWRFLQDLEGTR